VTGTEARGESSTDTRPRRGDLSRPEYPRLLTSMRDFLGFDAPHLNLSSLRCRFAA
jgi:hypothetical protein